MANELKLGGTYRHYKTKGLYTALQLVRFENRNAEPSDMQIAEVTFTGDGPLENRRVSLHLTFSPSPRLYLQDDFGIQNEALQVLYWSKEHRRYFVRPLLEFVADVGADEPVVAYDQGGNVIATGSGYSRVPRFELVS